MHRWKNHQRVRVHLPLFPGYVFVRLALRKRLQVLQVPGVVRLVGFNGLPTPLPDEEMEALRHGLAQQLHAQPHPYLAAGQRVRITSGPLAGLDGFPVRTKGNVRFVLSIQLISRSVLVDIDGADLEPVV
jgi:transcription antitermination factor NusG